LTNNTKSRMRNDIGKGRIVIYQTEDGKTKLEVRLEQETIWLDAHQNSTCAKNAQVAADGKIRVMDLYNLDMIISVGYRVNSLRNKVIGSGLEL